MRDPYTCPADLVLGVRLNNRVPLADQRRQRTEVEEILSRLRHQPGVILADEVGMGKTFVALGIAYTVAASSPRGPVILMVPANLVDKWVQDLRTFAELYLDNRQPLQREPAGGKLLTSPGWLRYGIARHSIELMKLLDDPPRERCHLIFLAQGAMGRRQTDKWVRLALIAEALRRHGRGGASRLIRVKNQIHRFLGRLLWALGEERAHEGGTELWERLLHTPPANWMGLYNEAVQDARRRLTDDPVPKSVARALARFDLSSLAEALKEMPVRACGGEARVAERVDEARKVLRDVEDGLWKELLAQTRWRSPLLVMDEAHHLKNPGTALARQLQSIDSEADLRTGDGAMAGAFDRMLFLTATPFQLGHHELIRVLERFGDVRWDDAGLGDRERFRQRLMELGKSLDASQRAAIALQRCWSRLRPEDRPGETDVEAWWEQVRAATRETLSHRQRSALDAFDAAMCSREAAEQALRPWIVRHDKGSRWAGTGIFRRQRLEGAAAAGYESSTGLSIPSEQLLPFFLAARSAVNPGQDLLGEALCSSYEAFRHTRQERVAEKDEREEPDGPSSDFIQAGWYLAEFDRVLERCSGANHPKVHATVRRVVDLWEAGEKVLVFAFYRRTCRALRLHISREIERRMEATWLQRLRHTGGEPNPLDVEGFVQRIQKRYFDDTDSPGRRAVDAALAEIVASRVRTLEQAGFSAEEHEILVGVMRRFLRVPTTLVRCFPISDLDAVDPKDAVMLTLGHTDGSGLSWRQKFEGFLDFLTDRCSRDERQHCLEAARRTQTGGIRVEQDEDDDGSGQDRASTLANVQVATGATHRQTRQRLMRAFNTPFFPDILVCSEVMGEGVDLQRFCRHVIHHDLAWNPSTIEQRTGRIDRLGCKAEGRQPIVVYLPFLAGTADERQYRVMSDRERWFRVVMGQDEVAKLIAPDSNTAVPLPDGISASLSFKLGIDLEHASPTRAPLEKEVAREVHGGDTTVSEFPSSGLKNPEHGGTTNEVPEAS